MQKYTAIIRDRNQLTLPQQISSILPWVNKSQPIVIHIVDASTVTISPATQQRSQNWDTMWQQIDLARSFKGQNKVTESAAEFLRLDRESGH